MHLCAEMFDNLLRRDNGITVLACLQNLHTLQERRHKVETDKQSKEEDDEEEEREEEERRQGKEITYRASLATALSYFDPHCTGCISEVDLEQMLHNLWYAFFCLRRSCPSF